MDTMKMSPGMVKMFSSGSRAPVAERQNVLRTPALGPASITHAKAPRKGGVTNDARTRPRISPGRGTSVRAVSHASGAPMATETRPTQNASTTVFQSARRSAGSVKTSR